MNVPETWLRADLALIHGEDGDARLKAVEAWKSSRVDPEWAEFALSVCSESAPWAEVVSALSEAGPMGIARVVIVPQADHLLQKPKDLPAAVRGWLTKPPPDTHLLLVARNLLSAGPGKPLGAKPFSDWMKEGRVLKVGVLEGDEIRGFVEREASAMGLRLDGGVAALVASRIGGHAGLLRRTLEVLDLLADDRRVSAELVAQATFRLAEQSAFAWSQAWQKGQVDRALEALHQALEDDPGGAPLLLLGQARREAERICNLAEAKGLKGGELLAAVGLGPRQDWLLEGYQRVLAKLKTDGARRLLARIGEADLDIKGRAVGPVSTLTDLTLGLCRAWALR